MYILCRCRMSMSTVNLWSLDVGGVSLLVEIHYINRLWKSDLGRCMMSKSSVNIYSIDVEGVGLQIAIYTINS